MPAYQETQITQLVLSHLPKGAVLLNIEGPASQQAIYIGDLSGDGIPEISAVYELSGEGYVMVLTYRDHEWKVAVNKKGHGYGLTLMTCEPILEENEHNLVIGWQLGSIWSKLSVYKWEDGTLVDAAPDDLTYSLIEITQLTGINGEHKVREIALWMHDTGEAYQVKVLRFKEGKFVTAWDVYPFYFVHVVKYYEDKTKEYPNYPFYWYYLADAEYHAGMLPQALQSVHKNLQFQNPYPSRDELDRLKRRIEKLYKYIDGSSAEDRIKGEMETSEVSNATDAFKVSSEMKRKAVLFPVSEKTASGTKWGYINESGEYVIQPIYSEASDFQNGLAVVAEKQKYGMITNTGEYFIAPIYESISPYIEKRAIALVDAQHYVMLGEEGETLTEEPYFSISNLHENRAVYAELHKSSRGQKHIVYGYLDADGKEVIPAEYEEAYDYKEQKALVKKNKYEYALINQAGERLATYPYHYVGSYGEGLLVFQETVNGKYGYMDEKGTAVIPPSYSEASAFEGGLAVIMISVGDNLRYGVINKQGTFIISAEYDDIRDIGEERWAVGRSEDTNLPSSSIRYAVADRAGTLLTKFIYRDVSAYKEGLASVSDEAYTYFIDRTGNAAGGYPRMEGDGTLCMKSDNRIEAFLDRRWYYIDHAGEIIWEPKKSFPLGSSYLIKEEKCKPNGQYIVYYPEVEGMRNNTAEHRVNMRLTQLAEAYKVPKKQDIKQTYFGDYDVIFYKKKLVVIEFSGYRAASGVAHGIATKNHAHFDLESGRMFMLRDLYKAGADYVKEISRIVGQMMNENPDYSYVFLENYQGIAPDQPFYVTDEAVYIYFAPNEIGPYTVGFPTFRIGFDDIKGMIYKEGEFWRSFHD